MAVYRRRLEHVFALWHGFVKSYTFGHMHLGRLVVRDSPLALVPNRSEPLHAIGRGLALVCSNNLSQSFGSLLTDSAIRTITAIATAYSYYLILCLRVEFDLIWLLTPLLGSIL